MFWGGGGWVTPADGASVTEVVSAGVAAGDTGDPGS
jgi:hypothetical protein